MNHLDEDEFILSLSAKLEENVPISHECAAYAAKYDFLARKSYWAYEQYCKRTDSKQLPVRWFQQSYLDGWADFYLSAAQASKGQRGFLPQIETGRKLFVVWHFPEYPLLFPLVKELNALVLIAQQARWMALAGGEENLYNFLTANNHMQLIHAFRHGRPIVAMMDYCYEKTAHMEVDFLSYKAKTPSGLIELAKRFKYTIEIITFNNGHFEIADFIQAGENSAYDILYDINRTIEKAILADPPRWLLWPSVDRRWIGIDY